MARGFLKDVGGVKRMRFVKPGYDANNMSIPQNAVIFDSEDIGNLSVYRQDTFYSGVHQTSGVIYNDVPIATWPELPFAPLVTAQYRYGQGASGTVLVNWSSYLDVHLPHHFRLWSSPTGLNLYWYRDAPSSLVSSIYIKWQAFRVAG